MPHDENAEDPWSDEERARRVGVATGLVLDDLAERVAVHAEAMGVSPRRVMDDLVRAVLDGEYVEPETL